MASACSTVRDAVTAISGTRGTMAMLRGSPGGSTSRSLPMPCARGARVRALPGRVGITLPYTSRWLPMPCARSARARALPNPRPHASLALPGSAGLRKAATARPSHARRRGRNMRNRLLL